MPTGTPSRRIRPVINLSLDRELQAKLMEYHRNTDPDRPALDTVRELLWIALTGSDATTGVLIAARKVGLQRARAFALRRVSEELAKIAVEARTQAIEADTNVLAEAQLAVNNSTRSKNGNQG